MKQALKLSLAASLLSLLAACATTESRIKDHQSQFDAYPPAAQQKIRAGQVDLGFTPDMVQMALGEPDRRFQRNSAQGQSEVWAYRDSKPMFSLGLGGGSFGGSSGLGGGVGVATGGDGEDKLRVIFEGGVVSSIETTK